MAIFKKHKRDDRPMTPAELMERSKVDGIRYRDLQVVAQLEKLGYNLNAPRHVLFYLYFPGKDQAETAAEALRARGHQVGLREPRTAILDWAVVAESRDRALIPDFLRDTVDFCEDLAKKHGGRYDGWEAGPDLG